MRSATVIGSNEYDGLSLKEMRDFVLTMIQRKEELEAKLKGIDANYKEELQKSKDISDKLGVFEQDTKIKNENYENKIQNYLDLTHSKINISNTLKSIGFK